MCIMEFKLHSKYQPTGDQPQTIEKLVNSINAGNREQTLLGVTGSGKTFTMANVIQKVQRPTLVLAHNKTLAAQLCSEFKEFFPENAVEYFVSYYDYYQPEAYVAQTDTYIEKDSSINDEIDKLRHSATLALSERRDVIIVASVSCIYSLGDPIDYRNMVISLRPGMEKSRDELVKKLVELQYERNDVSFTRNKFRVRGDVVEIFPAASNDSIIRVEFFGDEIDRISEINPLTGELKAVLKHAAIYPASHYIVSGDKMKKALAEIDRELEERLAYFRENGKLLEAQRLEQRTRYDMEMLQEIGFCTGIENYSRIMSGRAPGSSPYTLLSYFPDDFLLFVDESHVTLPQVRGMFAGDYARKKSLIDYGFRLPSALDNRPLNFDEFYSKINQAVYVSATPGDFELEKSAVVAEQIIRPTGLLDPEISVRPTEGQLDDLVSEINIRTAKNQRTLVTTLTKKMAEDLTAYLEKLGIRVRYMHHDIDTVERMEIVRDLRLGEFDVLVGINLLREGLDIPEVSLVAVLDADKEGFLRSTRSLIQIAGRAARNSEGTVIMYADSVTPSMKVAITETQRRREIQNKYNVEHGIVPKTIVKKVSDILEISTHDDSEFKNTKKLSKAQKQQLIEKLTKEMKAAATYCQEDFNTIGAHETSGTRRPPQGRRGRPALQLHYRGIPFRGEELEHREPDEIVRADHDDEHEGEHVELIDRRRVHPAQQAAPHDRPKHRHRRHAQQDHGEERGHAARGQRVDEARRLRERDDEQRRLRGGLALHGEEEDEDGQVEGAAADAEEGPARPGAEPYERLRPRILELEALDARLVERVGQHEDGEHDEHGGLDRADELGVGEHGPQPVEQHLADHAAHRGADGDGRHRPRVDIRLPARRVLRERGERHDEHRHAREEAHRAHAHDVHRVDHGLDDHAAADATERPQKRRQEAYREDQDVLRTHPNKLLSIEQHPMQRIASVRIIQNRSVWLWTFTYLERCCAICPYLRRSCGAPLRQGLGVPANLPAESINGPRTVSTRR